MQADKRTRYWIYWSVSTALGGAWLAFVLLAERVDKSLFMPGTLGPGHYQLEEACDVCHTDAFGGGEVLQQSCVDCHGEQRVKPFDSHPKKKFRDPRNTELLEKINAVECTSCHVEHKPEITARDGVTQPGDFCFYCHEDIGNERESHQGMAFDTCKNAGCHNYHNNRAIYTDFLIKHLHEPAMLDEMQLPQKEFVQVLDEITDYPHDLYPVERLDEHDIDANDRIDANQDIRFDWLETAHARTGVNCSACHIADSGTGAAAGMGMTWNDHPDHKACTTCHAVEVKRFEAGKHGMRLQAGLSPMRPAMARLPMKGDSAHRELNCSSCHGAHRYDVADAAVEACLECHDDRHSLAYKTSPHYQLWKKELAGETAEGTGVSCASCHMPRISYDISEWSSRIVVDHNQSANLSPNTKMVRDVCLTCHGLELALDALADAVLVENNFTGRPGVHVESMDLAMRELERRTNKAGEDDDGDMFGF